MPRPKRETRHYKYPFEALQMELRRAEPRDDGPTLPLRRIQWEKDVRAVARAIAADSLYMSSFDPEDFCHRLGVPFSRRYVP